jgi:RNA polymerase sigma factor (TIGR02999 family)
LIILGRADKQPSDNGELALVAKSRVTIDPTHAQCVGLYAARLSMLPTIDSCPFDRKEGYSLAAVNTGSYTPENRCISQESVTPMNEVTRILSAIEQGDPQAAQELLPLVYDELRKLAAQRLAEEKPGQTLQATALVHEAYLRLVGAQKVQPWDSRGHFFAAAAEAMRRILINRARDKKRAKRGGERRHVDLDQIEIALDTNDEQLFALDEALSQLAVEDPDAARLVNLRFFAGLTLKDTAVSLGLARRTAERQWAYARAWLYARLRPDGGRSAD